MARSVPLLRPSEAGIAAGIGETGIGVTVVLLRHVRPPHRLRGFAFSQSNRECKGGERSQIARMKPRYER